MRPDEIKPGKTYEGMDGERLAVNVLEPTPKHVLVWYLDAVGGCHIAAPLDDFAAWAVREVPRG